MIPAKQKPSKKRKVLNMGTLTEKATVRPNTSMNSTEMISTGWRPNLKMYISKWWEGIRDRNTSEVQAFHFSPNFINTDEKKSHQSARTPNTRYPKMEPTNRENFAMWTFHAESHTRLHCGRKQKSPLVQGHALCRLPDTRETLWF